jgi:hypothetical protein
LTCSSCAHSMSSAAVNPPSARCLRGKRPRRSRTAWSLCRSKPRSEPVAKGATSITICSPATLTTWTLKAGRKPPSAIFITRASGSVVEARFLRFLTVLALALLALFLHLAQGRQGRRNALGTFARRAFFGRADPPVAGIRIVVDFALEPFHGLARHNQVLLQRRTPPERSCPRARPHSHPVLRQRACIDQVGRAQRRQVLRQQPIEQIAMADPSP